jgi:hypothetical protein
VLATVASLSFLAAPAWAVEGHVYSETFATGELALGEQSGLAINQEAGELYVADTGNSRVAKYTVAGAPDGTLAMVATPTFIAVDNSTAASKGSIYVVNTNRTRITKYDTTGAPVASWGTAGTLEPGGSTTIAGIAVDDQGDLWILTMDLVMRELSPTGQPLTQFFALQNDGSAGVEAFGLAVDSDQNLYFKADRGAVKEIDNTGTVVVVAFEGSQPAQATSPTVNRATGDLYLGARESCPSFGILRFQGSNQPLETFGRRCGEQAAAPSAGLAVLEANNEAFVATRTNLIKAYLMEDVAPPTVSIEAPTAVTATTAHVSGHVNPNAPAGDPPSYELEEWGFTCNPACSGVSGGPISPDNQEHLVGGTLAGLQPGTRYTVTLTAVNSLNKARASSNFKTAATAPEVGEEVATGITPTDATLNALIRPRGADTTYRFDYVPEAAFLREGFAGPEVRSTAELGPIPAEEGETAVRERVVSARIGGLAPMTPYRFRVVATNSVGSTPGTTAAMITQRLAAASETNCLNQVFRTGPGALLPDCRAYEQVSPNDKAGLNVEGFLDYLGAADDGSGVTYFSQAATGIPASGGAHQDFVTMLAGRNGESWSTQRLLSPEELGQTSQFLGASANFRYALIEGCIRGKGPGTGCGLFLEDTKAQTYTEIVPRELNQLEAPAFPEGTYAYDSITADGSRVFFETKAVVTANAAEGKPNLYMWDRVSGGVALVGVLPGAPASAPPGGSFGGAYSWFEGPNLTIGGGLGGLYVQAIHAISEGGDRAYFTAGNTGQIYLRRNLTSANPSTLQVSAPGPGGSGPTMPAAFQEATPDGSRAFFISGQKLTEGASAGSTEAQKDLYRYDATKRTLVDVTPATAVASPGGAQVQGLLGTSSDGTSGYFAAKGVLASGATEGPVNLYRFEEDGGGSFAYTFIATMSRPRNWSPTSTGVRVPLGNESYKTSRVTPDGNTLVYSDPESTGTTQLWLYSVSRGQPFCVSCTTTSEPSLGQASLSTADLTARLTPRGYIEQRLTHNLSTDGTRLVFQTPNALVAGDENSVNGCLHTRDADNPECEDVYEWEAPGTADGTCRSVEVNSGCLYLLSTGRSTRPSNLIDTSVDGSEVFIATASQLVPTDHDELFDVYDAGIGRGVAAQQVTSFPPCNSGEECQGTGAAPAPGVIPGTANFQGLGNPKPRPKKACHKGARKKCKKAKKHHGKHRAKRKHNNRQHGKHRANKTKSGGSK